MTYMMRAEVKLVSKERTAKAFKTIMLMELEVVITLQERMDKKQKTGYTTSLRERVWRESDEGLPVRAYIGMQDSLDQPSRSATGSRGTRGEHYDHRPSTPLVLDISRMRPAANAHPTGLPVLTA